MAGRCRAWYVIAVTAITLFSFIYLLPKYWSPSENTNLGVLASGRVHTVSLESQLNPQTSQQPSSGQSPRLATSDSNDRNRANKTGYPARYNRGKAALEWNTHAQSRQILRSQVNFTEIQNGAICPLSPLNRNKIWLQNKKDRSQC